MAKPLQTNGGYRKTVSFQTTTIIYDATWWFCEKFLDPGSRMADQMVQAARSGRLNIAGGSRASATSTQTELRLLNLARSSLEKLLMDFEDFLRHRHLPQWDPEGPEAKSVRDVSLKFKRDTAGREDLTGLTDHERWNLYKPWLEHDDPAIRANALICLINQANCLLDRQNAADEKPATTRLPEQERKTDKPSSPEAGKDVPKCPQCGKQMVLRSAKKGKNAGGQFWGCSNYPECKGVAKV